MKIKITFGVVLSLFVMQSIFSFPAHVYPVRCGLSNGARMVREDIYSIRREDMVQEQIIARGIENQLVIEAMRKVPRHKFVPAELIEDAYYDSPLPLGYGVTISQPYIVAYMTELLGLTSNKKVLELGTGCGYQAAILAEIAKTVYTMEIIEPLYFFSQERLKDSGYTNIKFKLGNGYYGWEEFCPYDAIIVTCAFKEVPPALIEQLAIGGIMVIPIDDGMGSGNQYLTVIKKTEGGIEVKKIASVRFVRGIVPESGETP